MLFQSSVANSAASSNSSASASDDLRMIDRSPRSTTTQTSVKESGSTSVKQQPIEPREAPRANNSNDEQRQQHESANEPTVQLRMYCKNV